MMKRYLGIAFLSIAFLPAVAQQFKAEATLPATDADGFYRVLITPEASTYPNQTFSNVRLYDAQQKEVPYILEQEQPVYQREQFREYTILEKKQEPGCCTTLILENRDKAAINNINLLIRNAEVVKEATLSGSDDQKSWFVIKEKFTLQSIDNPNDASAMKVVNFPLSNYTYYQLRINDSTQAPLNIIKAGYYNALTSEGAYTKVAPRSIATSDSIKQKKTYIHVLFDTLRLLDKVELSLTGTPYFMRQVDVFERQTRNTKKGARDYYEFVTTFGISSAGEAIVHLPMVKTRELVLVVDNKDNPSLTVSSVSVHQLNRYLVAWLKKGEKYTLRFGDEQLAEPSYDLAFFKDSLSYQSTVLKVQDVHAIQAAAKKEESPTFFTDKRVIWVAIILVIGILGFMSVRLIRETNSQKKV
jgi:hypothetical protein